MKTIYLHIGRHKSGTKAIQINLNNNREYLQQLGFYYPKTGIRKPRHGHHDIAKGVITNSNILIPTLIKEITAAVEDNIIISSEAFQNFTPSKVRTIFKDFNIIPICYIREQASYLKSSYLQEVRKSNWYCESVISFYKNWSINYWDFLTKWDNIFPGSLIVRIYDRSLLYKNDIVYDFISKILGVIDPIIKRYDIDKNANHSLSSYEMLRFKLEYNRRNLPNTPPRVADNREKLESLRTPGWLYYNLLHVGERDPYELPISLVHEVRAKYNNSNTRVESQFLKNNLRFIYHEPRSIIEEPLSNDRYDEILNELLVLKENTK